MKKFNTLEEEVEAVTNTNGYAEDLLRYVGFYSGFSPAGLRSFIDDLSLFVEKSGELALLADTTLAEQATTPEQFVAIVFDANYPHLKLAEKWVKAYNSHTSLQNADDEVLKHI